eukprot:5147302-Prymnesium_polylepis.1
MREFVCEHDCELSVEQYWDLRYDVGFDFFCADELEKGGSSVVAVDNEEEATEQGTLVTRTVTLRFNENPIPKFLRPLVSSLAGEAEHCSTTRRVFCRERPAPRLTFVSELPGQLSKYVHITGEHWAVATAPERCRQCTIVRVGVRVPVAAASMEEEFERSARKAWAELPAQCAAYAAHSEQARFARRGADVLA